MTRAGMRAIGCVCLAACAGAVIASARAEAACDQTFDGTFALIQSAIFERHGCTSAACHDAATASGGLDLTAGVSYDNLVDAPVQSIPPRANLRRV